MNRRTFLKTTSAGAVALSIPTTTEVNKEPTNIREKLQAQHPDIELIFLTQEKYDKAILGVAVHRDPYTKRAVRAVKYNTQKVIEANTEDGMTWEEAYEFWEYNQAGAYVGEQTPIFT